MSVHTLLLSGNSATPIEVECHMTMGLPALIIVGFANRAVSEARERLRSAFSASRLTLPTRRITVNLAPADIPKESTAYDIAIAVSILAAQGLITPVNTRHMFFGELGLKGDVRPVRGLIGALLAAQQLGFSTFYVPNSNLRQALMVPNITVVGFDSLYELYLDLSGVKDLPRQPSGSGIMPRLAEAEFEYDFRQIVGQPQGRRSMEIAAAGRHHVLLSGPPGVGKTMLAKALPSVMPPMTAAEILEVSHLHSLATHQYDQLIGQRPIRAPHHSASMSAITGGSNKPRPGEVSLAHRGVLFLDELPEFKREVIESLRQPLEDNHITITRDRDSVNFPADFVLVATANPCPCGNFGSKKQCTCLAFDITRYQQRLSGPLLDRIDLYVDVVDVEHAELLSGSTTESSATIAQRVLKARQRQLDRGQTVDNARLNNADIKKLAHLTTEATFVLNRSAAGMKLSARAYMRVLKVARTIADLADSDLITDVHMHEALQFRKRQAS